MDKLEADKIEKIERLEDELHQVQQNARAMYTQAKAKAKDSDETIEIERQGETVEVTEIDLWQEMEDKTATPEGKKQAKEILEDRHPGVFEKMKSEQELAEEISETFAEVFDFNFKQISPGRMITIVRKFVEYSLEKEQEDE